MFLLTAAVYLPVITGICLIAMTLFLNRSREKSAKPFSAFAIIIALWLLFQFLAQLFEDQQNIAFYLVRVSSAISPLLGVAFFLFVRSFIAGTQKFTSHRIPRKYLYLLFGGLIALNFTPLMIQEIEASPSGLVVSEAGILYFLQILLIAVLFIVGLFDLLRDTFLLSKQQRTKNYLLIFALGQAIIAVVISTLFLPASNSSQLLIPASIFLMVLIVSFAIIRHKLFDIRLFVARALAYFLLVSTLIALYVALVFGIATNVFTEDSVFVQQVLPIVAALFVAATAPFFKKLFDKVTNKFFYRDAYDPQAFLDQLNKTLVGNIELGILLRQTTDVIQSNLKSEICLIGVRETDTTPFRIIGSTGPSFKVIDMQFVSKELAKIGQKLIVTDELPAQHDKLKQVLNDDNISIICSLSSAATHELATAYLILGHKKSGNVYSKQDLRLIEIISDELVIAIQNALRFEEIQGFAITLQNKVNEATAKLRHTNAKLKEMDETKDEFISMASHQLRTPLTSVKGYLSMVLDGDAGKLNSMQHELLDQAFVSSQRMVYLIADLLNVSRLKTGKFIIDAVPTDLTKVAESELAQLTEAAKTKKIKITIKKPDDFPELMLDETKTRQVIMNFVDNALYYTPSGGEVTIELRDEKGRVYFMVKDDGIGVPKEEQEHLFTKFYRAKNARKARPDGTGLGLFMAKKVIAAQGGDILFESKEGKGSMFGFSFDKAKLQPSKAADKAK